MLNKKKGFSVSFLYITFFSVMYTYDKNVFQTYNSQRLALHACSVVFDH